MAFGILKGIFDRVGLRTNVQKTVGFLFRPCRAAGVRVDEAYTRSITVEGGIFKERQWERFLCPKFGKDLAKGSLVTHLQTQNGVDKGGLVSEGGGADGGNDPRTYCMAFPVREGPRPCPV